MYYLIDMCFLCLKTNVKLQSVLIQDIDGIVVNEKLRCIFPEFIDSTPDAHKLACSECLKKLRIPHDFKQSVRNTVFKDYIDKLQCQHKSHQQLLVILTRLKSQTILAYTRDFTAKKVEDNDEKHGINSLKIKDENLNFSSANQEQLSTHQSCQLTTNENDAFFIKFNCQTKETNLKTENIEIVDPLPEEIEIKEEPFVDVALSTNLLDEQIKTHDQSCQLTNENVPFFTKLSCQPKETNLSTEDVEVVNPLPEEIYIKQETFVDDDFTSNYSDEESTESDDILECPMCHLSFSSLIYLENHTGRCNKKSQKPKRKITQKIKEDTVSSNNINGSFKCHVCDHIFTIKSMYDQHLLVKHCKKQETNAEIYQTNATKSTESTSTSGDSDYNDQPKQESTKKRLYKCNECHKECTRSGDLERHRLIHSGEKPYQCQTCDKTFTHAFNLNTHKLTHTGEKPHKCDVCDKTFRQKGHLIRHKRSHNNIRPYQCSVCSKAFSQSSTLTTHMRLHTGETPYQCHVCEFKSSDSGNLKSHLRTLTGEKPYKCTMCSKSFTESGNLTRHMRVHTGEKPYECHICQFKCAHYGTLKYHIRAHTNDKPYQCKHCKKSFKTSNNLNMHLRKLHN